jgi:hypothetical protein
LELSRKRLWELEEGMYWELQRQLKLEGREQKGEMQRDHSEEV